MLSVLIPTNNTKYIEALFQSIDTQTWKGEYEVIVAVDGCKECTKHLLDIQYKYDFLNIYDCPTNMGVYKTINALLELAEGDKMLIFGSDDIMHQDLFKSLYEVEGDFYQFRFWNLHDGYAGYDHTKHFAAGAVCLSRKALEVCGTYKSWRYSADSEYVERVKCSSLKHVKIDKEMFWYRNHKENLTATVDLTARAKQRQQIKFGNYGKHEIKVNGETNTGKFVSDESLQERIT